MLTRKSQNAKATTELILYVLKERITKKIDICRLDELKEEITFTWFDIVEFINSIEESPAKAEEAKLSDDDLPF